jgi:hypothetical protein
MNHSHDTIEHIEKWTNSLLPKELKAYLYLSPIDMSIKCKIYRNINVEIYEFEFPFDSFMGLRANEPYSTIMEKIREFASIYNSPLTKALTEDN